MTWWRFRFRFQWYRTDIGRSESRPAGSSAAIAQYVGIDVKEDDQRIIEHRQRSIVDISALAFSRFVKHVVPWKCPTMHESAQSIFHRPYSHTAAHHSPTYSIKCAAAHIRNFVFLSWSVLCVNITGTSNDHLFICSLAEHCSLLWIWSTKEMSRFIIIFFLFICFHFIPCCDVRISRNFIHEFFQRNWRTKTTGTVDSFTAAAN